jgi:hypothetical protein
VDKLGPKSNIPVEELFLLDIPGLGNLEVMLPEEFSVTLRAGTAKLRYQAHEQQHSVGGSSTPSFVEGNPAKFMQKPEVFERSEGNF